MQRPILLTWPTQIKKFLRKKILIFTQQETIFQEQRKIFLFFPEKISCEKNISK